MSTILAFNRHRLRVQRRLGVTPTQKLILISLAARADRAGVCECPNVATLAAQAVCSPRTVKLGLKRLAQAGWICSAGRYVHVRLSAQPRGARLEALK